MPLALLSFQVLDRERFTRREPNSDRENWTESIPLPDRLVSASRERFAIQSPARLRRFFGERRTEGGDSGSSQCRSSGRPVKPSRRREMNGSGKPGGGSPADCRGRHGNGGDPGATLPIPAVFIRVYPLPPSPPSVTDSPFFLPILRRSPFRGTAWDQARPAGLCIAHLPIIPSTGCAREGRENASKRERERNTVSRASPDSTWQPRDLASSRVSATRPPSLGSNQANCDTRIICS